MDAAEPLENRELEMGKNAGKWIIVIGHWAAEMGSMFSRGLLRRYDSHGINRDWLNR